MPKWVDARYAYYTYGVKTESNESENRKWHKGVWSAHYWYTDYSELKKALIDLMEYCNLHQYEIKSSFPLTMAKSYDYGQTMHDDRLHGDIGYLYAGLGYGWGLTQNVGFVVLLQRTEEISEEEYARRMEALRKDEA